MKKLVILIGALASVWALSHPTHAASPKPNVILMMADDLGYDDLSCYGSNRNLTPRLDQLAREGMKLRSFYAGATVCSPSRMALLSGSYPARLGWQGGVLGYGMHKQSGLSTDVFTIAEAFKAGGYRTAMSGKWHVGDRDLRPHRQGFDTTYYLLASNNIGRDVYRGDEVVHKKFDNRKLSQTFTEEVIRIINNESDKPFFIYVPFTAPHFPADAHPDWKDHSKNGAYGDVVEELDHRVGQILDAVKKKGIDDNTIVVFMSDNGTEGGQRKFGSSAPFSGGKWTSREGGTRVPCIVRWPGVVRSNPAGIASDEIVAAIDLYPTLAHACGIEIDLPDGAQKIDGRNVWGVLTGRRDTDSRTELLYWHGWGEATAIRGGDYKLYFGSGTKNGADPDVTDGPLLYNLAIDPGETKDISAAEPERVKQMLFIAKARLVEIHKNRVAIGSWEGVELPKKVTQPQKKWGRWLE